MSVEILPNCALFPLHILGDSRGSLIALEGCREVPFDIARVYYIFATQPGVERGFHAHRELNQVAVCVSGSCTIIVDDGSERREVPLDRPDQALRLGPMIWHEMRDFSPDCVLMVLADAAYDEKDYIRDYDAFLAAARAPS
jgi:dTDP-4-dehydrorhamnose 3,5-epimerase-like enzyme